MAIPVAIKVYAAFYPVSGPCLGLDTLDGLYPSDEEWLLYEDDMLRVSFEGLVFPHEEVLSLLKEWLPPEASGKMDVIDLEEWTLTRHVWEGGNFTTASRSLNQVLEYSGH